MRPWPVMPSLSFCSGAPQMVTDLLGGQIDISKLNRAIDAHLRKPDTHQQLPKIGMRALGGTSEQLRERVTQDRANWSKILVGLKLDANK